MNTQEKGKPGPKKGWVAELREELVRRKAEIESSRRCYEDLIVRCKELHRDNRDLQFHIDKFNNSSYLERVLRVLFGGKV